MNNTLYILSEPEFREYYHLKCLDNDTLLEADNKNFRQWCSFIKRLGREMHDIPINKYNDAIIGYKIMSIIEDYPQVKRWFYHPEERSINNK